MKEVDYPDLANILSKAIGSRTEQELAEKCGVRQASVSKWLSGYNRPRPLTLAILAIHLNLDPNELAVAADYTPEEVPELYKFSFVGEKASFGYIECESTNVEWIHNQWTRGDPEDAIDRALLMDNRIEENLKCYFSLKYRQPLLEIRSKLLLELACAYSVARSPRVALPLIQDVVNKQYDIEIELNNNFALALAYRSLGDAYYGLGGRKNWDFSQWNYLQAFEMEKDDYRRLELARCIGVNSGYLVDKVRYKWAETHINKLLDNGNFSNLTVCTAMEGLGRGQAPLNYQEALKKIEVGRQYLRAAADQGDRVIYRQLQLVRSQLTVIQSGGVGGDERKWIEKVGEENLTLARQHDYQKYAIQIEESLKRMIK